MCIKKGVYIEFSVVSVASTSLFAVINCPATNLSNYAKTVAFTLLQRYSKLSSLCISIYTGPNWA